ncbi:hypothetical protein NDU88_005985 [Pleurodeles waltl]|uniref:Uncharacterized protein n=1 Tax=Pleurodeles waltl TaxID=8319 RepID=A0AAV7TCB0_PLEWA|nr:hypothetical protein NDU88_005985 [Pleurodeles waltl]
MSSGVRPLTTWIWFLAQRSSVGASSSAVTHGSYGPCGSSPHRPPVLGPEDRGTWDPPSSVAPGAGRALQSPAESPPALPARPAPRGPVQLRGPILGPAATRSSGSGPRREPPTADSVRLSSSGPSGRSGAARHPTAGAPPRRAWIAALSSTRGPIPATPGHGCGPTHRSTGPRRAAPTPLLLRPRIPSGCSPVSDFLRLFRYGICVTNNYTDLFKLNYKKTMEKMKSLLNRGETSGAFFGDSSGRHDSRGLVVDSFCLVSLSVISLVVTFVANAQAIVAAEVVRKEQ